MSCELYNTFKNIQEKICTIYDITHRQNNKNKVEWIKRKNKLHSFITEKTKTSINISTNKLGLELCIIASNSLYQIQELKGMEPQEILTYCFETFKAKNENYGSSYEDFGIIGLLIRMNDKLNRIISLENGEHDKVNEKKEDTLMDLLNYCVISVIVISGDEPETLEYFSD